jgi:hypothetical protein
MEGAEDSHTHGCVFENGTLTILADSGHSHALAEGQPGIALVPADAIVVVQASANKGASPSKNQITLKEDPRALAGKSTRPAVIAQRHSSTEKDQTMDPKDKEIASLKKTLGLLLAMSAAEFAVHKTLSGADAEAFIEKSAAERNVIVADVTKKQEEADKVIYVSKSTGDVYKAKDDARLVEMAKRMDKQADEIEKADVRKRATDLLGGMPGADDAHDLIVRSLLKSGAKQEEIDAAFATIKGMKATSSVGKKAPGIGGTDPEEIGDVDDAMAKLEKGLAAFAKAQNITKNVWTDGLNAFVQTDEGAALKRAYDEAMTAE